MVTGGVTERGWRRPFEDPTRIGDRVLVTLLDAGEYIATPPRKSTPRRNGKPRCSTDPGGGRRQPDNVRPYRNHASSEPPKTEMNSGGLTVGACAQL